MENQDVSKDNEYLSKILERYDFIESIIITDFDGSLMISSFQNSESKSEEDKKKFEICFILLFQCIFGSNFKNCKMEDKQRYFIL